MKPGEQGEAEIVDLAHDGRGVARVEGKAVFIAGALPGESVRFLVRKRRRRMDEAELLEVLVPSADRVVPRCVHFGVCGGCSLQHLAPDAQVNVKQRQLLDNLERIGRVRPAEVFAPLRGPDFAYRRRARLGVRYVQKKRRVLAGFRERDKPYLADVRCCEILIERFAGLPEALAELVDTLTLREQLPQVEVAAGDGAAALVLRVMAAPSAEDLEKLELFAQRWNVEIHLQSGGPDTVRPLSNARSPLTYAVDGGRITLEFGPTDFIQINAAVNEAMICAAIERLRSEATDTVLDLFCGLGNFTLPLARRARKVVGVDGEAALVARAGANAVRNGVDNAAFFTEDLFEPARFGPWAAARYDLILIDPPRAGAQSIMERMAQWRARRVVYISCHPGSLARDAGILVETQGFELRGAGVVDMFPHTTHVESIAVFERRA